MSARTPPSLRAVRLMSLGRAARLLKLGGSAPARALKRLLLQAEAETGRRIMVRQGGAGPGVRYRVTLEALQEHVPHLFARRDAEASDAATREVRRLLCAIERHQVELVEGTLGSMSRLVDAVCERLGASRGALGDAIDSCHE